MKFFVPRICIALPVTAIYFIVSGYLAHLYIISSMKITESLTYGINKVN